MDRVPNEIIYGIGQFLPETDYVSLRSSTRQMQHSLPFIYENGGIVSKQKIWNMQRIGINVILYQYVMTRDGPIKHGYEFQIYSNNNMNRILSYNVYSKGASVFTMSISLMLTRPPLLNVVDNGETFTYAGQDNGMMKLIRVKRQHSTIDVTSTTVKETSKGQLISECKIEDHIEPYTLRVPTIDRIVNYATTDTVLSSIHWREYQVVGYVKVSCHTSDKM